MALLSSEDKLRKTFVLDDIADLWICIARIVESGRYVLINYKDFVLNWQEGFSIASFHTYPKHMICSESEMKSMPYVIPFEEEKAKDKDLETVQVYGVTDEDVYYNNIEMQFNIRKYALVFIKNSQLGACSIKLRADTMYLKIKYDAPVNRYRGVDDNNVDTTYTRNRHSTHRNYIGRADIYRIDTPLSEQLEKIMFKNAIMGSELTPSTDGIRLYHDLSGVYSLGAMYNVVYNTNKIKYSKTVESLTLNDKNKVINLNMIQKFLEFSMGGRNIDAFEFELPSDIDWIRLGGWNPIYRCTNLSSIKRIGSVVAPCAYHVECMQQIAPSIERLYACNGWDMDTSGEGRLPKNYLILNFDKLKFFGECSIWLNSASVLDLKDNEVDFSFNAFYHSECGVIIKTSNEITIQNCLRSFRYYRTYNLSSRRNYDENSKLLMIVVPDSLNTHKYESNNVVFIPESEYESLINQDNSVELFRKKYTECKA